MKNKIEEDLDIITEHRINDILDWADYNKWFDPSFVIKMSNQNTWSAGQRRAIENIWEKFIEKP